MELTDRSTETRLYGDVTVRRACESARKLERAGDYEGARLELRKFWTRIGVRPFTLTYQSRSIIESWVLVWVAG
jgi:hypothetical protein